MDTATQTDTHKPPPSRRALRDFLLVTDVPDVLVRNSDGQLCGVTVDADDRVRVVPLECPF